MKIFFFALITFVIFCYQCESVEVECEFNDHYGPYECRVQNDELITSKENCEVFSIGGKHLDGKSDSDVTEFSTNRKVVKFFPRGLTKFFKKVESVAIAAAGLEEVSKEDLKQFGGKLRELYLWGNKIEIIDADLFEFNPNLEKIHLGENKIKQIGSGAFNGLAKLKTLKFNGNPCTSPDDVQYERSEVLELIEKVEASCKNL